MYIYFQFHVTVTENVTFDLVTSLMCLSGTERELWVDNRTQDSSGEGATRTIFTDRT
jgi:hypothetical protein